MAGQRLADAATRREGILAMLYSPDLRRAGKTRRAPSYSSRVPLQNSSTRVGRPYSHSWRCDARCDIVLQVVADLVRLPPERRGRHCSPSGLLWPTYSASCQPFSYAPPDLTGRARNPAHPGQTAVPPAAPAAANPAQPPTPPLRLRGLDAAAGYADADNRYVYAHPRKW